VGLADAVRHDQTTAGDRRDAKHDGDSGKVESCICIGTDKNSQGESKRILLALLSFLFYNRYIRWFFRSKK